MPLGLHMHSCCGDENCFVEQLVKTDSSLSLGVVGYCLRRFVSPLLMALSFLFLEVVSTH
jgi:hypothetical protein